MSGNARLGDVLSKWWDVKDPPRVTENIQVWRVELTECNCFIKDVFHFLNEVERQRASRTRAGEARQQFIAGRAILRLLLGSSLAVAPAAVTFSSNQYGKLQLLLPDNLHFNVAHSREIILIALTRSGPVGIDVEALDRAVDVIEVAYTAFCASEILQLQRPNSSVDQLRTFFRCWTRKEAVVKADGCGLTVPLTKFAVPMSDANGGDVLIPPHERCAGDTVRVGEIVPGDGYIGALAGISQNQRVIGYSLSVKALTRLISQAAR